MISENSIVEKSTDIMMSVIDNEAVILGIKNGNYIGLNEVGTEIWSRLSGPLKVSELVASLVENYAEEEIIIKEQVLEFLNALFDRSLIQISHEDIS